MVCQSNNIDCSGTGLRATHCDRIAKGYFHFSFLVFCLPISFLGLQTLPFSFKNFFCFNIPFFGYKLGYNGLAPHCHLEGFYGPFYVSCHSVWRPSLVGWRPSPLCFMSFNSEIPRGLERTDVEPFEWLCCVYDDGFPGAPALQAQPPAKAFQEDSCKYLNKIQRTRRRVARKHLSSRRKSECELGVRCSV